MTMASRLAGVILLFFEFFASIFLYSDEPDPAVSVYP